MKKSQKNAIAIVVSLLVATVIIYFQLKALDLEKIKGTLKSASYIYVLPSVMMGILAFYLRGLRWRLMLEPLGYKPSVTNTVAATLITYFANIPIPRSGEVFRCTALYASEGVPVDKSFGTVIVERVVDFICLGITLLLAAFLNYDLFKRFVLETWAKKNESSGEESHVLYYLLAGLVFLCLLLFFTRNRWKDSGLFKKVKNFLNGIKEGVVSIKHLRKRNAFIFYSVAIWVLYYFMIYVMIYAFAETSNMSFSQGFFILVAGSIGMVIPASGGFGSYHAALGIAFSMMGMTNELGTSFAILVHEPHTAVTIILGIISSIIIYLSSRKRLKQKN